MDQLKDPKPHTEMISMAVGGDDLEIGMHGDRETKKLRKTELKP